MASSKPLRGFQINTILDRLGLDMLKLLGQCLVIAPLDRDRLYLSILATLSRRRYVEGLLFRDFRLDPGSEWYRHTLPDGSSIKVYEQAIVYLEKVLARRPKLARRLRHEPGNMHLLLGLLARHGPPAHGWAGTEVRRDRALEANGEAPDFLEPLALALSAQRLRLGADYGEDSRRRRSEYGPIWLIRGTCTAELPEEMSLFDVTEATPVPLEPDFILDQELQRMLVRVLDSLNERYMLLRASGLDPEVWHDRDEPSIGRLRELKQLRRPAEELLRQQIEADADAAYRRAFDEIKGKAAQLGGFATFDDFATSEVGMAILRHGSLSLDEPLGEDDDGDEWVRHEVIASPATPVDEAVLRRREASDRIRLLIDDQPEWFDQVMVYFFEQVIAQGRPIHSEDGEPGVVDDLALRRLVRADPALRGLPPAELAEELYERAEKIIRQGLKRSGLSRN
jgi:hypothetical protein